MSSFVIKCIACITMFLDHIKYSNPIFCNFLTEYFGRLSFPIFAFLVTESYRNTSDLKKYYKRLFLFGVVSQIPFMLFRTLVGEWKMLNILFTLLLGLVCINVYDKISRKYISIPIVIIIAVIGEIVRVDYGWLGVLTVFLMYLFKERKIFFSLIYGIAIFTYYYYSAFGIQYVFTRRSILLMLFTWISIFIINKYNGEKGRNIKFFFYWFYPIHMLGVYLLHFIF